jgi:hypothetical protein
MYTVTLNEVKVILEVSAQARQNGGVNKTSVEATAQNNDFWEVKTRKRRYSDETSQTAKKSTISVPKSAGVKLPTKAVITRNLFAPLRSNKMDTETTGAENALPEQEAPRKPGRPPSIMMTDRKSVV